jgi:hypothetical protein
MIPFKCSITNEDTACKSAGTLRGTLHTERGIYYFIDTTIEKMMPRIIAKLAEVESCIKGTDDRFCLNCGLLNVKHTTKQIFDCMNETRAKNGLPVYNSFPEVEKPVQPLTDAKRDNTEIMFNCPPVSIREIKNASVEDMAKYMADCHAAMRANDAEGY